MTDPNTGGGAPAAVTTAPAATTAPVSTAAPAATTTNNNPAPAATTTTTAPAANDFKLPDAYKDKPWASKIKTQDDLYKQLDETQTLIGKKVLPQMDLSKALPEDLQKFNEAYRPADVAAYGLKDYGLADDHVVGNILHEAGVPIHQGRAIIEKYQAAEKASLVEATSEAGFKAIMSAKFGEAYDPVVAQTVALHKKHLSPDTQKLFDGLPNNVLGGVYELTENMRKAHSDEIAALKKEYGVVETGAQGEDNKGGIPLQNVEEQRADLRKQIAELDKRPHSTADKKVLTDKLHATYANAQPK